MSKVLFTHSYFYKFDSKQWETKQPYPPLATITAASFMRSKGYDVALFDTNLISDPEKINPVLEKEQPDYLVIYDDGFNYLTKMCLTNMREAAFRMVGFGKSNNCIVIASSSDSTDHYEKYLNSGVDYVILGEGEITLNELIGRLENNESSMEDIPGIAFRKEDKVIKTVKREILTDLDALPMAAWDLVDINSYKEIWMKAHGYFSLNIATTRGCPFKCNWCAKPIYGNRYNTRSPEKVADEIAYLIKHFQPTHFWMCDDIFGLKPKWAQAFRDVVKTRSLKFRYKIQSRVDLLLKEDTINALAESGLETVWVGAESGSQKILDAMDKGTTVEQIFEVRKLLKKKNVKVAFFLQFGYLGETKEDIQKTINMVLELMPDDIGISISYPLPGTKFYEKVKNDLKQKQNWTDSNDLELMFKNTFNAKYYKKLHQYVHKIYRRQRGLRSIRSILQNPLIGLKDYKSALSTLYYVPAERLDRYKLSID